MLIAKIIHNMIFFTIKGTNMSTKLNKSKFESISNSFRVNIIYQGLRFIYKRMELALSLILNDHAKDLVN